MRKHLVEARKNNGYTQTDIATQLGISTRFYQSMEAGTATGNIQRWAKLSKMLEYPLEKLLEDD